MVYEKGAVIKKKKKKIQIIVFIKTKGLIVCEN